MSIFVVDSNFFIEAHRATYPLDVARGFWNKIQQLATDQRLISIDKVKAELFDNHEDELKEWCEASLPIDFFAETGSSIAEYTNVIRWANSRSGHYLPRALSEFLDGDEADAFLVGFALVDASNRTIVTQEKSEPLRQNKIKIPEPCNALGVNYCNTIEMFRRLGETF